MHGIVERGVARAAELAGAFIAPQDADLAIERYQRGNIIRADGGVCSGGLQWSNIQIPIGIRG